MFQRVSTENNVLCYAYELFNEEDVYTYQIEKRNEELIRIRMEHYYYFILGEKLIEKLKGRGYVSMEEVYQKYQVTEIPIEKKEGFMKTFFRS